MSPNSLSGTRSLPSKAGLYVELYIEKSTRISVYFKKKKKRNVNNASVNLGVQTAPGGPHFMTFG